MEDFVTNPKYKRKSEKVKGRWGEKERGRGGEY
jgi:hypothetical protein